VLEGLLRIYKSEDTDSARFLDALEKAAGVPSAEGERLFLNWDEAREMVRGGMAAGSHTHTHELLAKLTPDDQFQEVRRSRHILREQLKVPVDTLAYPVGSRQSFSDATFAALARAGYRAAFSFYGGVNLAGRTDPYNIRRIAVDAGQPYRLFRAKAALTTFTGKDIIR
jgi:peptidoglycan/xylan/chitin deacetylase (PgdA/CDA1 family)